MAKVKPQARTGQARMAAPKILWPDLLQKPMSVSESALTVMIAELDCCRASADCLAANSQKIASGNAQYRCHTGKASTKFCGPNS